MMNNETDAPFACDLDAQWGDALCPFVFLRGKFLFIVVFSLQLLGMEETEL